MALTREFIRKLAKESDVELPKEFLDGIIAEHTAARDAYAEEQVKAELAKQPTEKAGNVKDSEEYKTLKQSFDDYKAEVAAKETKAAKEAAYRAILKDANLSEKGIEKAVKYAEWDKIELEADGKLKGASDHIKAVKEEWAEYVTTTTTTGAKTSNPPANNGNSGVTKEDFQKMSYKDRLQIYNENPDLYNELTT
jgi:hypothetical protein